MTAKQISDRNHTHLIDPRNIYRTFCGLSTLDILPGTTLAQATLRDVPVTCPDCAKLIRLIRKVRVKGDRT